jgi:hypothetical protein
MIEQDRRDYGAEMVRLFDKTGLFDFPPCIKVPEDNPRPVRPMDSDSLSDPVSQAEGLSMPESASNPTSQTDHIAMAEAYRDRAFVTQREAIRPWRTRENKFGAIAAQGFKLLLSRLGRIGQS